MIYIPFTSHILFILPLMMVICYTSLINGISAEEYIPGHHQNFSKNLNQDNSPPDVKIILPDTNSIFSWGDRVRYEISVSDAVDGESRYGEINPDEVLLEIKYLPVKKGQFVMENSASLVTEEHSGLTLIRRSACFNCHADKTALVGPSFSDIADRYDPNDDSLLRLGKHITEGSSGSWDNFEMPPNENLSREEAVKIAAYILEQGQRKDRWIYPGLNGVFQIIGKPEQEESGLYILTASYINHASVENSGTGIRGEHTIVLEIE